MPNRSPRGSKPFEDVQHLDEVEPARGRRRGARDLETAVAAVDGRPIDRLVARQVVQGDDAARLPHVVGHRGAEVAAVEHARALRRDQPQGGRVFRHRDQIARLDGRAARQEGARGLREARQVGRGLLDRLDQVRRRAEAALGMADRGLHHGLEIEAAEARDRLRPRLQRAGHPHREDAEQVDVAFRPQVVGPRVGDGAGTCRGGRPPARWCSCRSPGAGRRPAGDASSPRRRCRPSSAPPRSGRRARPKPRPPRCRPPRASRRPRPSRGGDW